MLPTTQNALSLSCLTFTLPGPLTAHIISLDLASAPRLPFFLKHTLIRTAIRNGAVFELVYSPAIGGDENKRRNWWANARELIRVTNGKNIIISGGAGALADLRAPLDVSNLFVQHNGPVNPCPHSLKPNFWMTGLRYSESPRMPPAMASPALRRLWYFVPVSPLIPIPPLYLCLD